MLLDGQRFSHSGGISCLSSRGQRSNGEAMDNLSSPIPLMPCGLRVIDQRITYHTVVALGRWAIASNPCVHAGFRGFFRGASKKRSRNPYIHPLSQILKVSSSYTKKRYSLSMGRCQDKPLPSPLRKISKTKNGNGKLKN